MAKQKSPRRTGKLAGKTFAFAGKFGWGFEENSANLIAAEGGKITKDVTATLDYIVAGQGRGGGLPGDVAKAQKHNPAVQVLDETAFFQLLVPTRDELLRQIVAGEIEYDRWEQIAG